MRSYPEEAVQHLREKHTDVTAFGHAVEVRRSTVEERPGLLDPFLQQSLVDGAARAKELGVPHSRTKMLLKAMLRPEKFMVDMRDLAVHLVLDADADTTVDLSRGPVDVSSEVLTLHEHPVRMWQYRPASPASGPRPAFLHLHGGGFFAGVPTGRDNVLKFIADRADAVVFDLDYSLSPEVKFPHAVHETLAAALHIHERAHEYGVDPRRIVVGGGSAGANLTAAATLLERTSGHSAIAAQVLIAPALLLGRGKPPGYAWSKGDFTIAVPDRKAVGAIVDPSVDRAVRMMTKAYRGTADPDDPLMSPAMETDLSGLPPALVITCELDSLRPHGEYYAARLATSNVPVRTLRYRGILHATPGQLGIVPASEAIALEVVDVLRSGSVTADNEAPEDQDQETA